MNVSIRLAPGSGIVYTWHGCLGLYDPNHGDIAGTVPGDLQLTLAIDPGLSTWEYMADEVYFVRWGSGATWSPGPSCMSMVIAPTTASAQMCSRYLAVAATDRQKVAGCPLDTSWMGGNQPWGVGAPRRYAGGTCRDWRGTAS